MYIDSIGFKEIEKFMESDINRNKIENKFIKSYNEDPIKAILKKENTIDNNITIVQAKIIAALDTRVLPLPNDERSIEQFINEGKEMAKDIE